MSQQSRQKSKSPIFGVVNTATSVIKTVEAVTSKSAPQKINPNFNFTTEMTPKVLCHYHPTMKITNFCMKTECLMPLCAACVEVHQDEHASKGTVGKFELLENSLTTAYRSVSTESNIFVDDLTEINKFIYELKNRPLILQNQIKEAKQRVLEMVDSFFNNLQSEYNSKQDEISEDILKEVIQIQNQTQKRWEALVRILEKLNSEKCLKSLIKLYSKDITNQCQMAHFESMSCLQEQQSQVASFQVDQNILNDLNNLLSKFIKFYTPNRLYTLPLQPVRPQINQQQFRVATQSPIKQITQPNKPPQYFPVQQHFGTQTMIPRGLNTPQKLIPQSQPGQVIPMSRLSHQLYPINSLAVTLPSQFPISSSLNQQTYQRYPSPPNRTPLTSSQRSPQIPNTPSPKWDQIKYSPRS